MAGFSGSFSRVFAVRAAAESGRGSGYNSGIGAGRAPHGHRGQSRMKAPAVPDNEQHRIDTIDRLGILYSPAEERFDRITRVAQRLFQVPTALISLVGRDVQWFKSIQGFQASELPREASFCAHTILQNEPLVIPDTQKDPDFADSPMVTGEPGIRFYAGAPIEYERARIGTLCIIDTRARKLKPEDIEHLKALAVWVENELKVRSLSESQEELIGKYSESERRALIDAATGAWNRKGMDALMLREFARAKRTNQPMGLLHVGVDDYDEIRKRTGSAGLNEALRELAARLRTNVRPHDIVGRHDKREFLVYLVDSGSDPTWHIANRLLSRVRREVIELKTMRFAMSLSIGAASVERISELALERLTFGARAALKQARQEGGGLVVLKPEVYS